MSSAATWLLVGLFSAHFLGDFSPLATDRMHDAKASGGPVGPILGHAGVHGVLAGAVTFLLSNVALEAVFVAGAFVLVSHFVIDLVRAWTADRWPVLSDAERGEFWMALGADQLIHSLVIIALASWLV